MLTPAQWTLRCHGSSNFPSVTYLVGDIPNPPKQVIFFTCQKMHVCRSSLKNIENTHYINKENQKQRFAWEKTHFPPKTSDLQALTTVLSHVPPDSPPSATRPTRRCHVRPAAPHSTCAAGQVVKPTPGRRRCAGGEGVGVGGKGIGWLENK